MRGILDQAVEDEQLLLYIAEVTIYSEILLLRVNPANRIAHQISFHLSSVIAINRLTF